MPPKPKSGGSARPRSQPQRSSRPNTSIKKNLVADSTKPPQVEELPRVWLQLEEHNAYTDPHAPLPLDPYDEASQLVAPRGSQLHELLESDERASSQFAQELARMHGEFARHEQDMTSMVKYLEAEIRRKDLMCERLQSQKADFTEMHQAELERMRQQFERTATFMERIFMQKEEELMEKNTQLDKQIRGMSDLAELRSSLSSELAATKQQIFSNERAHKLSLDQLEKKFLAAREGLQREASERIAQARAAYKMEVGSELESESEIVRKLNEELIQSLKTHEERSDSMAREHAERLARIAQLKQSMELAQGQQEEYQNKHSKQQKTIEKLTKENEELQRTLENELAHQQRMQVESEQRYQSHVQPLQHELDAARQRALQVDDEHRKLRRVARRQLQCRREMETFFLAAIDETRQTARLRENIRKKENNLLESAKRRHLTLPSTIRNKIPPLPQIQGSTVALPPPSSISPSLSDLPLSDRECVLRLLYSKVSGIPCALTKQLPAHSFDMETYERMMAQIVEAERLSHQAANATLTASTSNKTLEQRQVVEASKSAEVDASTNANATLPRLTDGKPVLPPLALPQLPTPSSQQTYDSTFITTNFPPDTDEDEDDDDDDLQLSIVNIDDLTMVRDK